VTTPTLSFLLASATLLTACGGAPGDDAAPAPESVVASATVSDAAVPSASPTVVVFKSPTCGCCEGWVEHMRASGFTVETRDVADVSPIKADLGVLAQHASCHTSLVDGYVVEGHVPADLVRRLLAERPDLVGIAAPGMPIGSPGMEGPGAHAYEVVSWDREGRTRVYAEVDPRG